MKTKLLIVFAFCTFNLFSQTNLVPNGGFETWTNSTTLSNWMIENSVTQNTSYFTEGSKSAQLSIANSTTKPKITAQVPLTAGKTYTVKFKYKYVTNNYSGDHPISLNISQNGSATTLSSSAFATDNNWTLKETSFTPDQNMSYDLSISLFTFDDAAFNVLIDDVQVYIQGTDQYTTIPDVNFENKLIALRIDSGVADGKVLTSKIDKLTYLNVSKSSINDLTGIQDFIALESLDCQKNNLTTLDLSKNGKLITVNCDANKLTNFINTSNLDLTHLYCSSNQLTSLDVTKYIALKDLSFSSNKISTIDLSSNNLLVNVWCNSNLLTELNITNNLSLTELNCGMNQLINLNVTKNVALTNLYCHYNQITNIDVSQNINLKWFICNSNEIKTIDVSNNPKLEMFDCLDNKITSLDISKNPLIYELACENNQLTYLNLKNGANTILDLTYSNFVNNPNLTCILVDDVAYSNAKWGSKKDATATYNTDCQQYTLIPDVNFEKKLITLGIDSGATDGKVLTNNVNKLTTLDVSSSSITDLTGIQDFVALTTLDCSRNQLTTLNVTKNITLNSLSCTFNQLTTLDISKNVTLTDFNCSYNQLISLDVSKNLALNSFSCASNKLTSLEVSKNVGLTYFICHSNQLNTLNVSKNVALNAFACGQNQLTSLDVSKNIALTDLSCNANQLTTLDVSKNLSLNSFHCSANQLIILDVSKNVALDTFSCRENQLTTLDVSKNVALTFLHCSNNQLAYLDVSKDVALTYLNCSSNNLSALNLKNTKNTLLTNPNIDLSGNPNLSCILVDDATYSKAYWADKKDAIATYSSTCSTLGIEDSAFDKIAIYPNPTKGELHIDNIILKKATIYDALGKLVKTTTFTSGANDNTIHLTGLPKGVYYIYLESEGANTAKKIIVE
jgi:hypothetical protein